MNAKIKLSLCLVFSLGLASQAQGPDEKQTYLLRYSLKAGEKLRYEVTHVAKTKTRIRGAEQISQVHTISQRHWDVIEANDTEMVFGHVLDAVQMTQQQDDADEVRWDSQSNEPPPPAFQKVAEQIGQTLSTITVDNRGREVAREDGDITKASLGMGSLTLAFPEEPMAIGQSWTVPREIKARGEDGRIIPIKIREQYTLEKVKTGVATLSVRSQPLTPIKEESIRSQIVQQLSDGEIRFDLDNGHMLSKQLDWDETVVGFQGANSLMEYNAKLTERLISDATRTARRR